MQNDIKKPAGRKSEQPEDEKVTPLESVAPDVDLELPLQPIEEHVGLTQPPAKRKLFSRILVWVLIIVGALLAGAAVSAWLWYNSLTSPISDNDQILIPITIEAGSTPGEIGKLLEDKSLIRSSVAFDIYTYLSNTRSSLQAGSYRLSPADSTQAIVDHIVQGKVYQFTIRFLPGATLAQNKTVLLEAGFAEQEIDDALAAKYDSPLFVSKPSYKDLEGYIYGEDYNFNEGVSVKDILQATFDEFYKVISDNDMIKGFKRQGLSLYQAITLASIIQREVSGVDDQKQAAQVFYLRLKLGMALGSDVTYQYIADKLGLTRDPKLDNPYNTRRYAGLPPGPIATPGLNALKAVASPASGDYLYFLAGDDGKTYFAHTEAEHEDNKVKYCAIGCSKL